MPTNARETQGRSTSATDRVGLLAWLDDPRPDRAVRFLGSGTWQRVGYDELAAHVAEAAGWVAEVGTAPAGTGDLRVTAGTRDTAGERAGVVALALPNGLEFVAAYFGVLAAGGVPCPLPVPGTIGGAREYLEHVAAILRVARPTLVLTTPRWLERLREAAVTAGITVPIRPAELRGEAAALVRRAPARHALLQFTSGSTGHPRGVQVTWDNVEANIAAIREWVAPRLRDEPERVATWLPFHHDMGLIGTLLGPVSHQVDAYVMRPDQFLRDPYRWLECFGRFGCTMGGSPSFGYGYLVSRLSAAPPRDLSFGSWKVAIVGADRIRPAVLADFTRMLRPLGFRPEGFLPAYGLAEATLAVSGGRLGEAPVAVRVNWTGLRLDAPVEVLERSPVHGLAGIDDRGWLVSCGQPHAAVDVTVVDNAGAPLPPGHLGEIQVSGPCVADGYRATTGPEGPCPLSSTFAAAGLRTGDAGVLLDGDLYVLGRIADSVKIRGRSVYAEDIEDALYSSCALRPGSCVVLGGTDASGPVLVAVVENDDRDLGTVATTLAGIAANEVDAVVLRGGHGAILRTSSGKPRRRVMWERLLSGRLHADVAHEIRCKTVPATPGEPS